MKSEEFHIRFATQSILVFHNITKIRDAFFYGGADFSFTPLSRPFSQVYLKISPVIPCKYVVFYAPLKAQNRYSRCQFLRLEKIVIISTKYKIHFQGLPTGFSKWYLVFMASPEFLDFCDVISLYRLNL